MPYVFNIPNQRKQHTAVATNIGPAERGVHRTIQGCLVTMALLEDLAAKLNMDPVELLLKNIKMAAPENDTFHRADTYRDELMIASDLMAGRRIWRPRGQGGSVSQAGMA